MVRPYNNIHFFKFAFLLIIITSTKLFSQERSIQITGKVVNVEQIPIPQVNIVIKGTDKGTQTNDNGEYTLLVNLGDILLFSHLGMEDLEVQVERNDSELNVEMQKGNIELDEVEIEAKRKHKTQKELLKEYTLNKKLIKTSFGIIDKDISSSSMRIIDGNDLITFGADFLYSLENLYPKMKVVRNDPKFPGGIGVFLQRIAYSTNPTAIFDVDGFIYESPPTYLSSNDIERIAILERNAAISRYGTNGVGGVIIINTKSKTKMDDLGIKRTFNNDALLDSLTREANLLEPYRPYYPSYIKKMQKSKTKSQAFALYLDQKIRHCNNPYYFLEMYDFFMSHWGNNEESNKIFQYIMESFSNNAQILKALAYLQEQYGNNESALLLHLETFKLQPKRAQSYRDLANAYVNVGKFKQSLMYYIRYKDVLVPLLNNTYDAFGYDYLITTEMMNIFEQNSAFFTTSNSLINIENNNKTQTRIVFEWNNQNAEFELQFVAPDGYYDDWSNKPPKDVDTLQNLELKGYCSKQFFISKDDAGLWLINIRYKGNQSEAPTYLKVAVYHDYGSKNKQVDVKVYELTENKHNAIQLFKLHQN